MGDPIPTRKIFPLPNVVDVIILSRPCKLSKFIEFSKSKKEIETKEDEEKEDEKIEL